MSVPDGFKVSELGVIPEDWDVQPVGEAFEICNNLRYPISEEVRKKKVGDYPYYGPTKIQGYIDEYRIEGKYALIGEDGDHFLKWRDLPMTLLVSGKFNVNNHAHLVKGTKNLTEWFYYYFYRKEITRHLTRQGAGRYKLTKNTLVQILCAIPPLPEQKAIAQSLSDFDTLITALDQVITKKRNIKQSTMQQILTGKKRLPGFSDEWDVKKLGDVLKVRHGKSQHHVVDQNGEFPILATGGEIGRAKTYLYNKPSVLIGRKGTIDIPQYMDSPFWTIDTLFYTDILNNAFPKFIFYRFNLINWYSYNEASGVPSLNAKTIENIEIKLSSVEEQKAIAQVLSDMDAEIEALEKKRDKYKAIKQGMMQELLTGKTRLISSS
ncbi:restriction endonuclease subunit S [Anabaena sp. WA102]|uniref:restriction endonuclease subunit S n=1 Tax=Anabaena sp. WA102 TaxID=1647413 RepID=UPI0009D6CDCD|nr:restriction endonuclease subunit S [Anabaena sp. WA102]